jgi:hypothetical protein
VFITSVIGVSPSYSTMDVYGTNQIDNAKKILSITRRKEIII